MKLLLLIIVFLSGVVSAEIIHVPAEQPDIQSAINTATTGDTVLVSEGTFYENISFNGKAITVASMFMMDGDTAHISATVIDGSQASQAPVVTFNSSESEASVLSGFTISGGSGREFTSLAFGYPLVGGGGIFITSGATVSHNYIINNILTRTSDVSRHGAGIFIDTGIGRNKNVIIKNNRISNNQCSGRIGSGGGITIFGDSRVRITGNIITNNRMVAVDPVTFISGGGAININGRSPEIMNNVIAGNEAPYGGGIAAWSGVLNNNFRLINNTITGNSALFKGGGVYLFNGHWTATNNIFWNNSAAQDSNIFYRGEFNLTYSLVPEFFPGTGNIQDNPLFEDDLYLLSEASPAVDAGNPDTSFNDTADPENTSQPLYPARGGLTADMGAYGGNDNVEVEIESYTVRTNFEYRQFGNQHYRFSLPADYDSSALYPLTIVLTGSETSNSDHESHMMEAYFWRINAQHYAYNDFTIAPQSSDRWDGAGELETLYQLIRETAAVYPVDTTKIVLTGHSSGGRAAIRLLNRDPQLFSAAVPLSPTAPDASDPELFKYVPIWIFQGGDEGLREGLDIVSALEKNGLRTIYTADESAEDLESAIHNGARLLYTNIVGAAHQHQRTSYDFALLWDWLKRQFRPLVRPRNSYADRSYYDVQGDTVLFRTEFSNPHDLLFNAVLRIENFNGDIMDSLSLYNDGLNGDSVASDGIWSGRIAQGSQEAFYRVGVDVLDQVHAQRFFFYDLARFTTIGPVKVGETAYIERSYNESTRSQSINMVLENKGLSETARSLRIRLTTDDPRIASIPRNNMEFPDLAPQTVDTSLSFVLHRFEFAEGYNPDSTKNNPIHFNVSISSNNYFYWTDSFEYKKLIDGIEDNKSFMGPDKLVLLQNYPNPFNPTTTISYQIPITSEVSLTVYNMLGQKVATLVDKKQSAGNYSVQWDATDFASGVYFYKLETSSGSNQVKKLVLLK